MKCPRCGNGEDKVLDSRTARDGAAIRRRRECTACGCRFTTHEEIDRDEVIVVKRDGRRQSFDRRKLEKGVRIACGNRPVSDEQIRNLLDDVISAIDGDEIQSEKLGDLVMERLQRIDQISYIRFASVYRNFTDVNQFLSAITDMVKKR
jgi:transcriptional repressor NrdR